MPLQFYNYTEPVPSSAADAGFMSTGLCLGRIVEIEQFRLKSSPKFKYVVFPENFPINRTLIENILDKDVQLHESIHDGLYSM